MGMSAIERWCLRCADKDSTWIGLNWLRPAKEARVGVIYVVVSSLILGMPGILLGAGALYLAFGKVEWDAWVMLVTLVFVVEAAMHAVFAWSWNRRARQLQASSLEH